MTYVTATQVSFSDSVFSSIQSLDQLGLVEAQLIVKTWLPFTTTIPVIGIHSRDSSGLMVGLLRAGRASKCSWTCLAIRDGSASESISLEYHGCRRGQRSLKDLFLCKSRDIQLRSRTTSFIANRPTTKPTNRDQLNNPQTKAPNNE